MDFVNVREVLKEVVLDIVEGVDMVMVKFVFVYLDIICEVKKIINLFVVVYNVSGEYVMIKVVGQKGWIDEKKVMLEILISMKWVGVDLILIYFVKEVVLILK